MEKGIIVRSLLIMVFCSILCGCNKPKECYKFHCRFKSYYSNFIVNVYRLEDGDSTKFIVFNYCVKGIEYPAGIEDENAMEDSLIIAKGWGTDSIDNYMLKNDSPMRYCYKTSIWSSSYINALAHGGVGFLPYDTCYKLPVFDCLAKPPKVVLDTCIGRINTDLISYEFSLDSLGRRGELNGFDRATFEISKKYRAIISIQLRNNNNTNKLKYSYLSQVIEVDPKIFEELWAKVHDVQKCNIDAMGITTMLNDTLSFYNHDVRHTEVLPPKYWKDGEFRLKKIQ